MSDIYKSSGKTIYLNLIFHQHQPFYLNANTNTIIAPWVRTHTTKDYIRIPSLLKQYPNVHITINLTPSLLVQIQDKYLNALKKYFDLKKNKLENIDDIPSIELLFNLLLKPTNRFTREDSLLLYASNFSALSVNEVVRHQFPQFDKIYKVFSEARKKNIIIRDVQLLRELKFWFTLVNFHLDFLENPIKLADNSIVDLSDLVEIKTDHKYYLRKKITEEDCKRLALETYRMMNNFLLVHKQMRYDYESKTGQIELSTSPYSHPILPLLYDTDSAKECMKNTVLPRRFHFPEDAKIQIERGIETFKKYFYTKPNGIWPSEGAVSNDTVKMFAESDIKWFATDMQILHQSMKGKPSHLIPYNVKNVVAFFRDTDLSDKISFKYQYFDGEESADDFIKHILSYADPNEERVVSVILDGENAWEWYRKDLGARGFLNALFRKLEKLHQTREIVTITPSEYIYGNPSRGIPHHDIEKLPRLNYVSSGSWIHGDFSKWIGNVEKNQAWEVLLEARKTLSATGVTINELKSKNKLTRKEKYISDAYEYLLLAEGSDWFWWAGEDQESFQAQPFDELFYGYIKNIYDSLNKAGHKTVVPEFKKERKTTLYRELKIGTMEVGKKLILVKFICDASDVIVKDAIFIVGNLEKLGEWIPNFIRMNKRKKDRNIWEYEIEVPVGTEIQYKYTNSGKLGEWSGSEEFPALNRSIIVVPEKDNELEIKDKFGKI